MADSPSTENFSSQYPLQQHAGKVGYGPNYNTGASIFDKVEGRTKEVVGKVTHNPKLVNEGHDMHTGEQKRRKALGEDDPTDSPFNEANDPTKTTAEGHLSNGEMSSVAESNSQTSNASSVKWHRNTKDASAK